MDRPIPTFDRPPSDLKITDLQRKIYRAIVAEQGCTGRTITYDGLRGKHRPVYVEAAIGALEHLRWIVSPDSRLRDFDRRWYARTDVAPPR